MTLRALLLVLLIAAPVRGAIVEFVCDEKAKALGWCYSDQDGKDIAVFSFGVEGDPDAECPQKKAKEPECQAARMVRAFSVGWTPSIPCSQPLVEASICHSSMLGKQIGNPMSRRQFADREMRAALWQVVAQDWRRAAEAEIGPPPPMLMDGKEVP